LSPPQYKLPLRELESSASLSAPVLLSFDLSGISRQETELLQHLVQIWLKRIKSLAYTRPYGTSLPGQSASGNCAKDIILSIT
jgi:hypothetical protein